MKRPRIASDWRTLFIPTLCGDYVNDHTIYYDGKWHLIGITSKEGTPNHERYFVHAASDTLDEPMTELGKVIDDGCRAWAPCVTEHNGLYYMFYGPSPTKLAVSFDSGDWFGQEIFLRGNPPMACHRDHFVLQIAENRWVMYVTGVHNRKSAISCLTSEDLLHWDFSGFALTSGVNTPYNPSWGAMESPFVVKKDGLYYLFTTYTDCSRENYHNTLVFVSENPLSFGCYDEIGGVKPVARLFCHAPELLQTDRGWLITTCGWKDSAFTGGAVAVADLVWEEKEQPDGTPG